METLVMWFFLALVQVHGGVGAAYGTEAECRAEQAKLAAAAETIAISECTQVKLEPKK